MDFVIREKVWECDLTQLEDSLKEIREIMGSGDCWIICKEHKIEFIDDYGNEVANIYFE